MRAEVIVGDASAVLPALEAESFDALLTDPPYGLEFMGRDWDKVVPGVEVWREVLRVLKPGAFGLVFGGTRTFHRLAVALEDAGFEIRDTIAWLYSQGFPKNHDVSRAIDKAAGAERRVVSEGKPLKRMIPGADQGRTGSWIKDNGREFVPQVTKPGSAEAQRWEGHGTSLKPAWEPVLLVRKPSPLTYAANALEHGRGALNIDGTRIGIGAGDRVVGGAKSANYSDDVAGYAGGGYNGEQRENTLGRWPANLVLDEEAAAALDAQTGIRTRGANPARRGSAKFRNAYGEFQGQERCVPARGADAGGASRFFYTAKASGDEREDNPHPTVKPLDLDRWLAKLLLPPHVGRPRRLLVPFAGSGSEIVAALQAGWDEALGIELSPEYAEIAGRRIAPVLAQPRLLEARDA